jgi:hypothetical protein
MDNKPLNKNKSAPPFYTTESSDYYTTSHDKEMSTSISIDISDSGCGGTYCGGDTEFECPYGCKTNGRCFAFKKLEELNATLDTFCSILIDFTKPSDI